ncbi:Cytochrome b561/ferric reductase transmembrane [Trinorchestia longiramus]|nr:Cytochrome b561/ferric reductase transmembrane [Trinorchestia longiramus]
MQGDDLVPACRHYNNEASLVMTFNMGHSNVFVDDSELYLSNVETSLVDGNLLCRYSLASRIEMNGLVFDLDNNTYHLEVARGSLTSDGSLTYHDERLVSNQATLLESFNNLEASSDIFVVLHASFMVAAWVGAASSGIFIARYFKQTWKNYKTCNIDQWFHCHRFFMILTWSLTMVAFGLILWHVNGWTKIPADTNPHAYIGVVSIGLCFIQPFMAVFRCGPKHPRRPVFNWLHWGVGNAAQILGITAIFYGLELYGLPRWTWWLMIVFVGVHCVLHIVMSIGECVSDSKAKRQVSGDGMPLSELNGSRDMLQPHKDYIVDAPGGTFRKVVLALYLALVWLVVAALIVVIAADEEQLEELGVNIP